MNEIRWNGFWACAQELSDSFFFLGGGVVSAPRTDWVEEMYMSHIKKKQYIPVI